MKPLKLARLVLITSICVLSAMRGQAATWLTLSPENFFQQDFILEAGASTSVSATFGSRYFYEDSRRGVVAYPGLNSSGFYTVNLNGGSVPFQLQPYSANNLRKMSASSTVTIPMQAGNYASIALAVAAGNVGGNAPTLGYTLNYSDLSSSTGSFLVPDWGQAPTEAGTVEIFNVSRASGADTYETTTNFSFFGVAFAVDSSKTLTSVVFSPVSMPAGEMGILAISALAVPEPSVTTLGSLALGGLLVRRRRRA